MREYNDIEHGTTRLAAILGNPAEKKAKKNPQKCLHLGCNCI